MVKWFPKRAVPLFSGRNLAMDDVTKTWFLQVRWRYFSRER